MNYPLLLILILFVSLLHAEEEILPDLNNSTLSGTSGTLSTIVNGTVCAISGEYVDSQTDLTVPGPLPLLLKRTYSSMDDVKNTLERGWRLSDPSFIQYQKSPELDKFGSPITYEKYHMVNLYEDSGACLHYKRKVHSLKSYALHFEKPNGLTNCGSEEISARTNLKNQLLRIYQNGMNFTVQNPNGDKRHFEKRSYIENPALYTPSYEQTLSGHRKDYEYKDTRITKILSKSAIDGTSYGWLKFIYFTDSNSKKPPEISVVTNDGREAHYTFLRRHAADIGYNFYLSKVTRSDKPDEWYEYETRGDLEYLQMSRKNRPKGRYLGTKYYRGKKNTLEGIRTTHLRSEDLRHHRVKEQEAPVGFDATPIIIHQFDYHFRKDPKDSKKILSGNTDVYDAYKYKTVYHYNAEQRPTAIERYKGSYGNQKLYSSENFIWQMKGKESQSNLLGKYIKDSQGNIHSGLYLKYDGVGNVLSEHLYGNLTGEKETFLSLSADERSLSHPERYTKHFEYSQDGNHLLIAVYEDSGKGMHYAYKPATDLVAARYLLNHKKIVMRQFYEYNSTGVMTQIITDNGSSESAEDLTAVTQKLVKRIFPRLKAPVGLPARIDDLYVDLKTGQEILIKRILAEYSPQGHLLKQKHYGSDEKHYYTLSWKYDNHGNVIHEVDALGQTITRKYDENDNLIKETPSPFYTVLHSYDFSNRLIKSEAVHTDGNCFVTSYRYDYKGNKVASVDTYGNTTSFSYDEFNRLVKTIQPAVANELDTPIHPAIHIKYDILDNPVMVTNALGSVTTTKYNVRKQPIEVTHPDGTVEKFRYSLDGTLLKKISANGTVTTYTRDILGRVITETIHSSEGGLLSQTTFTYDAFHLLNSIDAEGHVTYYHYDGAGRLTDTITEQSHTTLHYDALGRIGKRIEKIDDSHTKVSVIEYDLLNRILEERIEEGDGTLLSRTRYAYDRNGNKTEIQKETQAGISRTRTEYNSANQIVKVINPAQEVTQFIYHYDHLNAFNQRVLQTIATDPLGNRTETLFDTQGRVSSTLRKNSLGLITSRQMLSYDAIGNCVQEMDFVILNEEENRAIVTQWKYNGANKLISQIEAVDTPQQKITHYTYNGFGQKESQIKPDGTTLHYTYNARGLLDSLSSSDGSISYRYRYNKKDRPVQIFDSNGCTERSYDALGNMTNETLANGMKFSYTYDSLNRPKRLLIPDGSAIEYRYDAFYLRGVDRIVEDTVRYSHEYEAYDLSGNLLQTRLAQQSGAIQYLYDPLGRTTQISSTQWEERAFLYDAVSNLTQYQSRDPQGEVSHNFQYDALYRLISESGVSTHTYLSDSLHNRVSKDDHSYSLNALNQLLDQGGKQYSYDLNGNLIKLQKEGEVVEYQYDALDRLIAVIKEKESIFYTYDSFNRRLSKKINDEIEEYLYYGQNEIGSTQNGKIVALRLLGLGKGAEIGAAVALELNDRIYVPLHDHNGNIRVLLDALGNAVETYRYTAFGEEFIYDADGHAMAQSSVGNPWRFSSKRVDEETGFIYFGRRYYAPDIGRWITPDPLGFDEGPNLYAYVCNNPLTHWDLYGLALDYSFNYSLRDRSMSGGQGWNGFDTHVGPPIGKYNELADRFEDRGRNKKSSDRQVAFYNFEQHYQPHQRSSVTSLKRPELPNGLEILMLPGIQNDYETTMQSAEYLSELAGGCNIHVVCRNSTGWYPDLKESCMGLSFIATEPVRQLHRKWDRFFGRKGCADKVFTICQSQGAIHVRNALLSYPIELRDRILVVAIAPGGYIFEESCAKVLHYRAQFWRDFIPRLDVTGGKRSKNSIRTLDSHPNAPFFDHSFASPTYRDVLKRHINNYINSQGTNL